VVDLFQQEVLLRQLNLKCAFRLLKFTPLVQFAKFRKLREKTDTHVTAGSFRVLQKQSRQFLVDPQKLAGVFLQRKFGVQDCPVVRSADKREQSEQMLKSISAENVAEGVTSPLRAARFYEDESGGGDEVVLGLRLGTGPFFDCWKCLHQEHRGCRCDA
jgi:hypothetical protein